MQNEIFGCVLNRIHICYLCCSNSIIFEIYDQMCVTILLIWNMQSQEKSIPYPPQGRSLEICWGRGVLEVKILEAQDEARLEFPGGRGGGGAKHKTFPGGVWIFSGNAQ